MASLCMQHCGRALVFSEYSLVCTLSHVNVVQAPVSGSKKPAIDGTLIFLAAGDESLYKECKSAFEVMGKADFFLGDVGAGARMKLVVNMVMGSMMCMHPVMQSCIRRSCMDYVICWGPSDIPLEH
jgi:6-phosphogluconate dehydrogenase (decarboxylating)